MSSPEENASQGSAFSIDLPLSQETVQQVLSAVGMSSGSDSNRFVEVFQSELTDADLEEELGPPVTGASSISISRAIVHTNSSVTPMWGVGSTGLSQGSAFSNSQPHLSLMNHQPNSTTSAVSNTHSPSPSPHAHQTSVSPHEPSSSTHFAFEGESPLVTSATPRLLTPPTSTSLGLSQSGGYNSIKPNIPSNFPLPGEYNFELNFTQDKKKSKNTTITYSNEVQRAYIKQGQVVPFHFKLSKSPPTDSFVRVMAIHKAPEMITDNLTCCPKHIDEQKRAGKLFPYHFVRPQDKDTISQFCTDVYNSRLSVTTPFDALQKSTKPPNSYTALYLFPCFTSEFPKCGQNVQLIFTLECLQEVLGRCVVDVRVCASPGRDREVDEKRTKGEASTSPTNGTNDPDPPITRRGRKRGGRSTQEEVIQCTGPPKKVCHGLSGKKIDYTIRTYPFIVPFIDVCVKMMEQVYNVPVDIDAGNSERGNQTQPSFTNVESWLDHLELGRYNNLLKKHGVNQLFQVPGITEEELKRWGMKNASHRRKFLDGKDKINTIKSEEHNNASTSGTAAPPTRSVSREEYEGMDDGGSPPLFGSQSPSTQQHETNAPGPSAQPPRLSHLPSSSSLPFSRSGLTRAGGLPSSSQQSFIGGSQSQSSQLSLSSTQPFLPSTFEVLQIQLRKTFNQS